MIVDMKTIVVRRGRRMLWAALGLASGLSGTAVQAQAPAPDSIMVASASAERDTSADMELLMAGDVMIVTASKTAQHISDSPAAVTVITAEQIQQSGATTIAELMRSVPGADVMEPNKSQANIAIRGFNNVYSNKILVMIDGRSINEDIEGNVFWNTEPLLLSRIARIEVVRGPGSVLYGADAFGGVINIITKTPMELLADGKRMSAAAAYGEHTSTFIEAANTQGKIGDWAVTVGAGYHGSKGFGDRQPDKVRDSFSTPILTVDAQKQTSRGSLAFSASNSDAKADLSVQTNVEDGNWHTNSFTLTYNEDKGPNPIMARIYRNSLQLKGSEFDLDARIVNVDLQQQRQISARHQLLYGGSYRQGEFQATPTGSGRHSENLASVFIQDQILIDSRTNLFAGVRWDNNSVYGSQVSPRLSVVRHLPKEQTLRLSYGTAFRAPTLLDTFVNYSSPLLPGVNLNIIGNTGLKPEKVSSFEAGYRKDLATGYVGLNLFYNDVTDLIGNTVTQYAPAPYPAGIPTTVQWVNQGKARAVGFELESGFSLPHGAHGLFNYAFQNVTYQNGEQVIYSPHHKINLVLNTDERRRVTGYLAAHFVGASSDPPATLRAYTTVDARLGYRVGGLANPWTVSLSATNLLDDRHSEYVDSLSAMAPSKSAEAQRRTLWFRADGKF
ncbi:TonB-dependent receptor [Capsulimonas sp.]|uniref:TonB-dependent receptor plug domain-containing protein n=2 Tax=Capsulimonas sp. TaxID=2494211 RepID=UPI003266F99B